MHASILAIALLMDLQVGSTGRYSEPTPVAAPASQIKIAPEAPQPTLANESLNAEPDSAASLANPSEPPIAPETSALVQPQAQPPAQPLTQPATWGRTESPAPTTPQTAAVDITKPSQLIRALSEAPGDAKLPGSPIRLSAALEGAPSRRAQTQRTDAYWALSAAETDYYLAVREGVELAAMRQGVTLPSAEWDVRRQKIEARTALARAAAVAAQQRLQRMIGAQVGDNLPLAVDAPHCGQYETRYTQIFASVRDGAAEQLSQVLPLRYTELRQQAAGIDEALRWLAQASQGRVPNSDGTELLRAHELLSSRRREFVETARRYNEEIASYAELAAPGAIGTDRLVGMLIRTSTPVPLSDETVATPHVDSAVQAAAAFETQPLSAVDSSTGTADATPAGEPQRFLGGRRRDVRRPLLPRILDREHSILLRHHRPLQDMFQH